LERPRVRVPPTRIISQKIAKRTGICRLRYERLNLQRYRIHSLSRNLVAQERLSNYLAAYDPRLRRIVNCALHDRAPERVRAQLTPGQEPTEIAIAKGSSRN